MSQCPQNSAAVACLDLPMAENSKAWTLCWILTEGDKVILSALVYSVSSH